MTDPSRPTSTPVGTAHTWQAVTLVPGRVGPAPVLALAEPLSFWGGLDPKTGLIIDRAHPQVGRSIAGTLLVMTAGRGSSSGSSVLAEAIAQGHGPAGLVLLERDAIVVVGVMVANDLYSLTCPVVLAKPDDWPAITAQPQLAIEAGSTTAMIRCAGG